MFEGLKRLFGRLSSDRRIGPLIRKALAYFGAAAVLAIAGLVGYELTDKQLCEGLRAFEIEDRELCTHGGDPRAAFAGPGDSAPGPVVPSARNLCVGDGRSGPRVFALYGSRAGTTPATTIKNRIRAELGQAQTLLGPTRSIRYRCYKGSPTVGTATMSDAETIASASVALDRADREYVVFLDEASANEAPWCGLGTLYMDGDPGPDNLNNTETAYSFIACWDEVTLLHEMGHNWGAVQDAAPHSSKAAHCWDDGDVMCYDDGGDYFADGGQLQRLCSTTIFDCFKDDYFDPNPAAPEFTWWNVADNRWLEPR